MSINVFVCSYAPDDLNCRRHPRLQQMQDAAKAPKQREIEQYRHAYIPELKNNFYDGLKKREGDPHDMNTVKIHDMLRFDMLPPRSRSVPLLTRFGNPYFDHIMQTST